MRLQEIKAEDKNDLIGEGNKVAISRIGQKKHQCCLTSKDDAWVHVEAQEHRVQDEEWIFIAEEK